MSSYNPEEIVIQLDRKEIKKGLVTLGDYTEATAQFDYEKDSFGHVFIGMSLASMKSKISNLYLFSLSV